MCAPVAPRAGRDVAVEPARIDQCLGQGEAFVRAGQDIAHHVVGRAKDLFGGLQIGQSAGPAPDHRVGEHREVMRAHQMRARDLGHRRGDLQSTRADIHAMPVQVRCGQPIQQRRQHPVRLGPEGDVVLEDRSQRRAAFDKSREGPPVAHETAQLASRHRTPHIGARAGVVIAGIGGRVDLAPVQPLDPFGSDAVPVKLGARMGHPVGRGGKIDDIAGRGHACPRGPLRKRSM